VDDFDAVMAALDDADKSLDAETARLEEEIANLAAPAAVPVLVEQPLAGGLPAVLAEPLQPADIAQVNEDSGFTEESTLTTLESSSNPSDFFAPPRCSTPVSNTSGVLPMQQTPVSG
jgi:hypothetical protein